MITVIRRQPRPDPTLFSKIGLYQFFYCSEYGLCIKILGSFGKPQAFNFASNKMFKAESIGTVWDVNVDLTYELK